MNKGIVSCPQPIAGEVGIKILENGGNAFDSALASAFCQWILDPFMNVGAVGVVAKKRGRRFIGFENNQDQILLAMKTINEREK